MPPTETITHESREETTCAPLSKAAIAILQQAIDLINTLSVEQYTLPSKVMFAGTIGKHIRHISDHFNLLYEACDDISKEWIVDYDIRERDNPSETDQTIAIDILKKLQQRVKEKNYSLQTKLTLLATIDGSDETKYEFDSSFGRELFYSCIHAIHHYASIKAVCIEQNIDVPKDFGMAPSTLHDQKSKK